MTSFNYFFTPVGPEYKKKFARNFGIAILILFAFYGIWNLVTDLQNPLSKPVLEQEESRMFGDPTNPRISYEGEPSSRTLLPYTENYNVPFDYEGRIDYDLLIKKLLPPLFQDKLKEIGIDVETPQMVLLRGPQIAMYEESSYQCGYVIDDDKKVYWLEGRIDKSKIYDVEVFTENPMPCEPNHSSCWCTAQTLAEEELLDFEKTNLTPNEEQIVVNYIYDYLKDNTNLNFYNYQVGKYHLDYGDENVISFCGVFGKDTPRDYFGGSVNKVTNEHDFHMERSLSPLCIISEDAKWHSFDTSLSPKPEPTLDQDSLFAPPGHVLGDAHEHASILVKIFGDRFDFSHPDFQVRSSWIHFEGLDGNTIHRHSKGIPLGYLFDTLNLKLTSDCFVFVNGREFCTNQDYSLKFYINGMQVDDIRDYVISQGDRILISYGAEDSKEIQEQFDELNSQEIID